MFKDNLNFSLFMVYGIPFMIKTSLSLQFWCDFSLMCLENAASSSLLYSLIPRAKRQTSWITLLWHLGDTWLLWVILHKSFSHSGSNVTQYLDLPSNSGFTIYAYLPQFIYSNCYLQSQGYYKPWLTHAFKEHGGPL